MVTFRFHDGICAALAASISVFVAADCCAKDLISTDMVRALAPTVARSLSTGTSATSPTQSEDEAFVNSVRDRGSRSLSVSEVEHLDNIVSQRKDVDLEMKFGYNSASLAGKALKDAQELGKALTSDALKDQTFLIMGHTDAKGTEEYNQKLSERRAVWVKDYLVKEFGVPAERLVPVGYGETHLKVEGDPNSAENRRVQVVNIMAYKAAKK